MKIVLRSDVDNIGKRGDIVDVADGHARNLLIPSGQAIEATPGIQAQADRMRKKRDTADAKDREAAESVARTLVPEAGSYSRSAPRGKTWSRARRPIWSIRKGPLKSGSSARILARTSGSRIRATRSGSGRSASSSR